LQFESDPARISSSSMLPGLWPSSGTELSSGRASGASSTTLAPPQQVQQNHRGMLSRLLAPLRANSGGAPRPFTAPSSSGAGAMAAVASSTVCVTEAPAVAGNTGTQFGYPQLEPKFNIGRSIGKGGNGVVREVHLVSDGRTFACKTIPKVCPLASSLCLGNLVL
jgi:hypothetical protein